MLLSTDDANKLNPPLAGGGGGHVPPGGLNLRPGGGGGHFGPPLWFFEDNSKTKGSSITKFGIPFH